MTDRVDAIIIGAGHNGLVCASYLARSGMKVLCLEAADTVGGMAAPRVFGDHYHVPGLAQVSHPLNRKIRKDLKLDQYGYRPGKAVDTVSLDKAGQNLVFADGNVSGAALPETDQQAWTGFRSQYLAFTRAIQPLFENTPPRLKDMPFGDKATLARLAWNVRVGLGRETMYEFLRVAAVNIYDVLNETFDDERLKGAVAVDAVMGSAMGPRTPGTVLTWLQRLYGELEGPLSVQTGGQSHVVNALMESAQDAGVEIRTGTRVRRILVNTGVASGVELENGTEIEADLVISNADPRSTFADLVGDPKLDAMFSNRVAQIRGQGVVAKLHLALNGAPQFKGVTEAQLGDRLLIAPSMTYVEHAFNHSKYQEYSSDPVLEICLPSVHNSTLAPEGHHVMSVNVAFVPYTLEGGWPAQKETLTRRLIGQLEQYAPGLQSQVVAHELLTPPDIEAETGAVYGHWHHGELSIHQSFMMRPLYGAAQYNTPIEGLFLCGAGCHPGGGLTGLPGHNAAKRILSGGGGQ